MVPTLVHDGEPIFNSFVITEYIEDLYPEKPLRHAVAWVYSTDTEEVPVRPAGKSISRLG